MFSADLLQSLRAVPVNRAFIGFLYFKEQSPTQLQSAILTGRVAALNPFHDARQSTEAYTYRDKR